MIKPPVFVVPHAQYDSYTDYWGLVKASQFETCPQDDVDHNKPCKYIISPINGDLEAMLHSKPNDRNCSFVLWYLERPAGRSDNDFKNDIATKLERERLDEVWFSDRAIYNIVKDLAGTRFIPMGSDEALCSRRDASLNYDFVHMSYVWGRRSLVHELNGKLAPNCWGEQRHETLLSSRFMVNIHQDDGLFSEPLRFALCAAYALPLISETCVDPYPYENHRDLFMVPYDKLKETTKKLLHTDYGQWRDMGQRMWETATKKFRFKNNVENALE